MTRDITNFDTLYEVISQKIRNGYTLARMRKALDESSELVKKYRKYVANQLNSTERRKP